MRRLISRLLVWLGLREPPSLTLIVDDTLITKDDIELTNKMLETLEMDEEN